MKLKPLIRIDPFFNEIPWEIIYDEKGRVLGEVYIIPIAKRPEYLKKGKHQRSDLYEAENQRAGRA